MNIKESHRPILETNPVLVVFLEGLAVDVLFTVNSTEASPVSETMVRICFPAFNVDTNSLFNVTIVLPSYTV